MTRIPLFDAHCDSVSQPRPLSRSRGHVDLDRLGAYAPAAQVFALWAPPELASPLSFRILRYRFREALSQNSEHVTLCRSAEEARKTWEEGKIAAFMAAEGGDLLDCRAAELVDAWRQGLRVVTLCWNRSNRLCAAALDESERGGLTEAGRRFAETAWELGVAVDLSHASEESFWDVLEIARRPVMCSHSDCRALCPHLRNLSDEQIGAMVKNRGVMGLNLSPEFLGGTEDIGMILAHTEHFLELGAGDCLCLGCDFDGVRELPRGIEGVESMSLVYEALLRRGISEEQVRKIFFDNLLRFMEEAL